MAHPSLFRWLIIVTLDTVVRVGRGRGALFVRCNKTVNHTIRINNLFKQNIDNYSLRKYLSHWSNSWRFPHRWPYTRWAYSQRWTPEAWAGIQDLKKYNFRIKYILFIEINILISIRDPNNSASNSSTSTTPYLYDFFSTENTSLK